MDAYVIANGAKDENNDTMRVYELHGND